MTFAYRRATTGAWLDGDPAGHRQFVVVHDDEPLALEAGERLGPITVAYETWGTLDASRSNAVLVEHALTGDSHAHGPAGIAHPQEGWWHPLIGAGEAIDTDSWFVVCPNVLGGCQGTTGPSSLAPDGLPYGSRFPWITPRDQVALETALADALGIERWAAVVGGSMGGMRVLEWATGAPERVGKAVIVAVGAYATAEQIGVSSTQNRAIVVDPNFRGGDYYDGERGPDDGLRIAREFGQISYRSELEFHRRFHRKPQDGEDPLRGGRYAIESYLQHHGDKLLGRFDANSYLVLSTAMNHHDVGRDRGGVAEALRAVTAETFVAGISTDRLYPLRLQRELAEMLPGRPGVEVIASVDGHDGFLTETEAVGKFVRSALMG
ncbi:MAG TPA: homoserine O-acetyltransferase [Acidimicrobiia bacterium]|jgi:homoserine O-acetyltransferase